MKHPDRKQSKVHQRVMEAKLDKDKQSRAHWSEMTNLYQVLHQNFDNFNELFIEIIQNTQSDQDLLMEIEDINNFVDNCKLLEKDTSDRMNALEEIYKSHAHLTGFVTGPDDHMFYLTITQQYAGIVEIFETVLSPTQAAITTAYDLAKKRVMEKRQDPNVITDVIVKD